MILKEVMGSDAKVRIQGGRVAEEGRVEIQRTDGSKWKSFKHN